MKIRAFSHINALLVLRQSFFAAPWIVTSVLLSQASISFSSALWLGAAFFSARAAGMSFNRLIDCNIDKKNPRTASRTLPRGDVTKRTVAIMGLISIFTFFIASFYLHPIAFRLAPFITSLLLLYSYLKRCTWLCHFVLGLIQFFGPFFASVAATNGISFVGVMLGAVVALSITANDILYACLDVEFDRSSGLYSVPACFGEKRATTVAKALHATAWLLLAVIGLEQGLSLIYFSAILIAALMWYKTHQFFGKIATEKLFAYSNTYVALVMMTGAAGETLRCGL